MKVLLIGKFENEFIKNRLDDGDEILIYSSDQFDLNKVKLKFRDYKSLTICSRFDVIGTQYVDIVYLNENFSIPQRLLNVCNEVVTDLPFDNSCFSKNGNRYVRVGQIMSFSKESCMSASSTVIVRSVKPTVRSFENRQYYIPGKIAIALKTRDIGRLSDIKYLDTEYYLFADSPLSGFNFIKEPLASKDRMLKVIETLSNAEFKVVL